MANVAATQTPLVNSEEDEYFGRNDYKPMRTWSRRKQILTVFCTMLFSPLLVPLSFLGLLLLACLMRSKPLVSAQKKTTMVLLFEALNKAPGKKLEAKPTSSTSTDILMSSEFVDANGKLNTCRGVSLRKSIEVTVMSHLRMGPYGAQIESDSDKDCPHYLLHGCTDPLDPQNGEVWTTHARVASWAALYGWSERLPGLWTQAIELQDCPDILGYIYLLEVSNPEFYSRESRIARVGPNSINAPDHTPETEGKIFARYGYSQAGCGTQMLTLEDPDAYIFKGKVLHDAELKVLHTFRIMKPRGASE